MTWRWGHGRAAMVSGLLLSTALACSSNDPIQSGNVNLPVVASTSPAYAGPYQWARLQLDQITLRPTDPQANAYLPIPLGLLRSFGQMDARSTVPVTVATTPLRAGTYRLESLRVAALSLNVAPTAPELSTGCSGTGELTEARVGAPIIVQFANPPVLQVLQDGSVEVNVVLDGPGFVNMLTSLPFQCGGAFPTPTPEQLAQVITVN